MSRLPDINRDLTGWLEAFYAEFKALERRAPSLAGSGVVVVPDSGSGDPTTGSLRIPLGGQLVVDGGDVLLLDDDGSVLFRIGVQQHGDRGVTINRDDGSVAIEIRKVFGPDDAQQQFRILDRAGRIIGGDSLLSFTGFDAPHVPIAWDQVNLTAPVTRAQSTSSGTFTALFEHRGYYQNPALRLQVYAWCSDGTTAGEVQVYNRATSGYLGGFLGSPATVTASIPAGTTTATVFELGGIALPGQMSDDLSLEIHARTTAGTGSVNVAVARSIGRGF